MEDEIKQFEQDLKVHLERTFNASQEQDEIQRLENVEKTAEDYVDNYLLQTNLIAGDVALSVQHVLNEFIQSRIIK
jgi:hypothetical protein